MKKIICILILCCAAASGAALHFRSQTIALKDRLQENLTQPEQVPAAPAAIMEEASPEAAPAPETLPTSQAEDLARLEAEIAAMQERLNAKDEVIMDLQSQATNRPPQEVRRRPWDNPNWMEDLKKNDPERYEEIMSRRKEAQEAMRESLAHKTSNLLYRDDSELDDETREERAVMLALVESTWKLAEQMHAEVPNEERREIRHKLRDNLRELEPLLASERDRQYYDIGQSLGYTETEAAAFVDYLNDVNQATSTGDLWGSMYRGRGRR